jgi:pimeloyl-ACP methyl ester carboxylesterase
VLSYDFAGLGSSGGEFAATTFSSDVDDLVAAARHLTDTMQPPNLLVGHCLGGAAVLVAAARLPGIEAVATVADPADVSHVRHLLGDDVETIRAEGQVSVSLRRAFVHDLRGRRRRPLRAGCSMQPATQELRLARAHRSRPRRAGARRGPGEHPRVVLPDRPVDAHRAERRVAVGERTGAGRKTLPSAPATALVVSLRTTDIMRASWFTSLPEKPAPSIHPAHRAGHGGGRPRPSP